MDPLPDNNSNVNTLLIDDKLTGINENILRENL